MPKARRAERIKFWAEETARIQSVLARRHLNLRNERILRCIVHDQFQKARVI